MCLQHFALFTDGWGFASAEGESEGELDAEAKYREKEIDKKQEERILNARCKTEGKKVTEKRES